MKTWSRGFEIFQFFVKEIQSFFLSFNDESPVDTSIGDYIASWTLMSSSVVSSISLSISYGSKWYFFEGIEFYLLFCRRNFFVLRCLFLFWLLSLELPDFRQTVNKNSGGLKLASENLDLLDILFQNLKKLIVLQKLEDSRILKMCINPIFILGAWGASSSWKSWLF